MFPSLQYDVPWYDVFTIVVFADDFGEANGVPIIIASVVVEFVVCSLIGSTMVVYTKINAFNRDQCIV